MEFESTAEREQLRAAVRRAVSQNASPARIRAAMESESGLDGELWKVLSAGLGLTRLLVPDGIGDTAARFADLAAALEELGRGPVCAPILGTAVLAPALLTACGGPVAEALLADLGPDAIATASLEHIDTATVSLVATMRDGAPVLDGTDPFVVDAPGADLIIVPALLDGSVAILAVRGDADGVSCTTLMSMDQTRRIGRVDLVAAPAVLVADGAVAAAALARARQVAQVALAAEQVGGAARCVEITVDYVKQRRQFGVPIGSFQAVKHACADMLVAVEFSRSAAEYAAFCVDRRPEDLPTAALVAASLCSDSYLDVAASTVQLHGGIGFTWDHDAHLYFKRAKASALMYGQSVHNRTELAGLLAL